MNMSPWNKDRLLAKMTTSDISYLGDPKQA